MRGEEERIKRCRGSSEVAVLPMDIIRDEILCRLPVEPLLRFKSVCKLWYSVIKDPNFIRSHYHHQNQSNRTRPLFQEEFNTDMYEPISFNPDAKTLGSSWPLVTLDPYQKGGVLSEVLCSGDEGDSLALFLFEPEFVDISVMDKEEEWHWIRHIVSYVDRPIHEFLDPLMHPELPITDSTLLKAGHNSFFLYNPKTNRCVRFREQSAETNYAFLLVFNFKESLFLWDPGLRSRA